MLILDLWGICFHAVIAFGLGKNLLFTFVLGHCERLNLTLGIVVTHGSHGCLKVCCSLLLDLVGQMMNFESVEPWYELICRTFWPEKNRKIWLNQIKI